MEGVEIHRWAAARAEELPGAYLDHPFGPEWDVYKVAGRVFMLQTALADEPILNLKCAPAESAALRQAYPEITPGYHMNKRHWITVRPGGDIDAPLIEDLVTESYLLVIEKNLPRSRWPVDPRVFGQRASE